MRNSKVRFSTWLFPERLLYPVLAAAILCVGLSVFFSLGLLPLEAILAAAIFPFLLELFFVREELPLLAFIGVVFGVGYFFTSLVAQGLMRYLFLSLVALPLLLKLAMKGSLTRIRTSLDKMLFAWLGVILIAFIYGFLFKGNNVKYVVGDLYKFVEIILIFWLTGFIVRSSGRVRSVVWGFLIIALIFGVVDSIMFFGRLYAGGDVLSARVRAAAQFSSLFALILTISLILHEKRKRTRLILTILSLAFLISFLLCFFRTGYIVVPLTLLFILSLYSLKNRRFLSAGVSKFLIWLVLIVILAALFSVIVVRIIPDFDIIEATVVRFSSLLNPTSETPMGIRMVEVKSVISNVLLKSPILGNGLGGEYYSITEVPGGTRWIVKHYVHNNYFEFLVRTGVVGLVVFIMIAAKYLIDVIRFYLRSNDEFYGGVLLGFAGIFVASAISAFSTNTLYSPLLFMTMAITYCIPYLERKSRLALKKNE